MRPSQLTLPGTPPHLAKMSRSQLLEQYDMYGDYWATWLDKAVMLPETQEDYTDSQLRKVIELASGPFAQQGYKLSPSDDGGFYDSFFEKWDAILGIPIKRRRNLPHRRPAKSLAKLRKAQKSRASTTRRSVRGTLGFSAKKQRHTKSQDIRRSKRPGPVASAAESVVGTEARGNDGKMYVVKMDKRGVKRWQKYKS